MYIDWTYIILVLPAVLFTMWASANVKSTYNKYSRQQNSRGMTGAQAARRVLDANGLQNVAIQQIEGELTDHYDPKANMIRLSADVYSGTSTAAIGVACHEVGHAIQYAQDYVPVKIRSAIIPVTNFGSKLSWPLVLAGLLLCSVAPDFIYLAYIGVACFALCAVFQLVTLPVEFNASREHGHSLRRRAYWCAPHAARGGNDLRCGACRDAHAAAAAYHHGQQPRQERINGYAVKTPALRF